MLLLVQSKALDKAPYKLSGAVAKPYITFWSLAFSYWIDKSWFLTEGKTCYCAHHTFLLGFPTGWLSYPHQQAKQLMYHLHTGSLENLCKSHISGEQ
jgi:hypothetical protein